MRYRPNLVAEKLRLGYVRESELCSPRSPSRGDRKQRLFEPRKPQRLFEIPSADSLRSEVSGGGFRIGETDAAT
jgi:hypothetical protein